MQITRVKAVRRRPSPRPARTVIAVAALPLGACVEIDLVVKA
jgi:enamine deaminase RidA (YjgF/YER057c/UK114 family)